MKAYKTYGCNFDMLVLYFIVGRPKRLNFELKQR